MIDLSKKENRLKLPMATNVVTAGNQVPLEQQIIYHLGELIRPLPELTFYQLLAMQNYGIGITHDMIENNELSIVLLYTLTLNEVYVAHKVKNTYVGLKVTRSSKRGPFNGNETNRGCFRNRIDRDLFNQIITNRYRTWVLPNDGFEAKQEEFIVDGDEMIVCTMRNLNKFKKRLKYELDRHYLEIDYKEADGIIKTYIVTHMSDQKLMDDAWIQLCVRDSVSKHKVNKTINVFCIDDVRIPCSKGIGKDKG